ncbi:MULTISPECIES: phosphatase PAP2 family protein [Streptomyces]|uniref:Phosphatase PAP2 family protein n=2 Tax=Streptomyces TaxID=1883 RepID=A0ABU4KCU6_9ACTN|nr:phosphatase PAP2 family protein [Streptomyces roseolus]MDX2295531.1 phosphatase PAP2 family protein [Streptomyces roseolus]
MSDESSGKHETGADPGARTAERVRLRDRPRAAALTVRAVLHDLRAVDGALYAAVAATPTPALDVGLRRLSNAADHSKISFAVAAGLALVPGRPRRAAVAGAGAIALASATANLLGKRLVRRPRPDREAARVVVGRHVPMPESASFPSGHTASAVAFATAAGVVLPPVAVPLGLLASAVGYSRVHTGVHYPGDVAAGAVLGLASGAVSVAVGASLTRALRRPS